MPGDTRLCLLTPHPPATRPPEELTLSPKLQLDGGLTMSSSSLQASPRGLLPGLLPGPADKLTPKGPGQVRVWVCEVQGGRRMRVGRLVVISQFPVCWSYSASAHVSPEGILASGVPGEQPLSLSSPLLS